MLKTVKDFLIAEDGSVIEWIIVIIAGSLIGAIAYKTLKSSPGNIGNAIKGAGAGAVNQLENVR